MIKYATLTCARNEGKYLEKTILSIINQTIPARFIVIVDDGSTDNTASILRRIKANLTPLENTVVFDLEDEEPRVFPEIRMIIRRNRGFSALGSYLLADTYNTGLRFLREKQDWEYLIIVPADVRLPKNYARDIIVKMDGYGVAGGKPNRMDEFEKMNEDYPTGGARVIRRIILDFMEGEYPRNYDYESSVIHCSGYLDLKVGRFDDVPFNRTRAGGFGHNRPYLGWGKGMKDANYHPLVALGRVVKEIIVKKRIKRGLTMLVGYLVQPSHYYPDYSLYLRENQKQRISNGLRKILRNARIY